MAKTTYYRQCRLQKRLGEGITELMSWIPEQFANVGSVVKLRDDNGVWEDGWFVAFASQTRLDDNQLPDYHKEIKAHRKATGDSQPKQGGKK